MRSEVAGIIGAVICVLSVSCSTGRPPVEGQVFVVTNGGQNIKLGLVSVGLFSVEQATAHIASRAKAHEDLTEQIRLRNEAGKHRTAGDNVARDSAASRSKATLIAERTKAQALLAEAEAARRKAIDIRSRAEKAYVEAYERSIRESSGTEIPSGSERAPLERSALERASADRDVVDEMVQRLRQRIASLTAQIARPARAIEFVPESVPPLDSEWYFGDLPAPLQTAETDADGRFALKAPRPGEYVLVARSQREVLTVKEEYFWMIRVTAGAEKRDVLLSNTTMTVSNSPLSMIHVSK